MMSKDQLIDEIRRAQSQIRRTRTTPPPAVTATSVGADPTVVAPRADDRANLRHLIGELASRLDRTQEQLLARLADLQVGPERLNLKSTASGRDFTEEILERLAMVGQSGSEALDPRLESIEHQIAVLSAAISQRPAAATSLSDESVRALVERLDRIEVSMATSREESGDRPHPSVDLSPVLDQLSELTSQVTESARSRTEADPDGPTSPGIEPILERLEVIEERLGGDAGAMTLGAAIARLGEALERIETRLAEPTATSVTTGVDGEGGVSAGSALAGFEEKLEKILKLSESQEGGGEDAAKAMATLKRDFSLLVHTINGHLQESRHRSDQVESTLGEVKEAIVPIAQFVGVEIGEKSEDPPGAEEETTEES